MSKERIIIDLHNGYTKGLLRLLALTFPGWCIFAGYLILAQLLEGPSQYVPPAWVTYASVFLPLCAVGSYLCLTNKLTLRDGEIHFPPLHNLGARANLRAISRISLPNEGTEQSPRYGRLVLHGALGEHFASLPLACLSGSRLSQFLRAIERLSPETKIQPGIEHAIAVAAAPQNRAAKLETVRLSYRANVKMHEMRQQLVATEKYFWSVWMSVWGLFFAYGAIGYAIMFVSKSTGVSNDAMLRSYGSLFNAFLSSAAAVYQAPVESVYIGLLTPGGTALAITFGCFVLFAALTMILQPNELILSPYGITLRQNLTFLDLQPTTIAWTNLVAVELIKPDPNGSVGDWFITLKGVGKQAINLNVSALASDEDKTALLSYLNFFAPDVPKDPDLIMLLSSAPRRSYTELWLQALTAPPKRERLIALPAGQAVKGGRYVVIEQLGVGGQGVAYLADDRLAEDRLPEQEAAPVRVVLKEYVLPVYVDKAARRMALEKFEREAKMLRELDHPQVVKMLDYFVEDHRAYLVLEHVDGASLRTIIDSSTESAPYPDDWAVDIALQMCAILEYLHGLAPPVVHRDFTPDNLILDKNGTLKLIDFNVAQHHESSKTGTVVGKHAYLPAEQFRGKPVPQSDIYAMGGTIYFLLTGEDPEPLTAADPSKVRTEIDPLLAQVVKGCMQLDLGKRYQGVEQIREQLEAVRQKRLSTVLPERSDTESGLHVRAEGEKISLKRSREKEAIKSDRE